MEIISIESNLLDSIILQLQLLADEAESMSGEKDSKLNVWLDNQDVCNILSISKRTLQSYRDNGTIPYTQIERKMFYKPEDVEKVLFASAQKRRYSHE